MQRASTFGYSDFHCVYKLINYQNFKRAYCFFTSKICQAVSLAVSITLFAPSVVFSLFNCFSSLFRSFHLLSPCQIIPLFRVLPLYHEVEAALKGRYPLTLLLPSSGSWKGKEWMRKCLWAACGTSPLPFKTFVLPWKHFYVLLHQYSGLLFKVMLLVVIVQR